MAGPAKSIRPRSMRKAGENELEIVWEDGKKSLYNTAVLRRQCPCAGCVDEWTGERTLNPLEVLETVKPVKIEPVGRYAIRVIWDDGHDTGIYTFSYLRNLDEGKVD